MYSALAHPIMERAAEREQLFDVPMAGNRRASPAGRCCATRRPRSFGDLVVLVNPAFEGTAATSRCSTSPPTAAIRPEQRPVMLTVTSQGDDATGIAFPLGRWVNTRFEHAASDAQRASIRQTVGHNDRYQTHELRRRGTPAEASRKQNPEEPSCGCPYLELTETFKWWEFAERIKFRSPGATKEADSKGAAKEADPKGPPKEVDPKAGQPPATADAQRGRHCRWTPRSRRRGRRPSSQGWEATGACTTPMATRHGSSAIRSTAPTIHISS